MLANLLEQLQNGTEEDHTIHNLLPSNASILEAEIVVPEISLHLWPRVQICKLFLPW